MDAPGLMKRRLFASALTAAAVAMGAVKVSRAPEPPGWAPGAAHVQSWLEEWPPMQGPIQSLPPLPPARKYDVFEADMFSTGPWRFQSYPRDAFMVGGMFQERLHFRGLHKVPLPPSGKVYLFVEQEPNLVERVVKFARERLP
jgi:hypothetical protein